MEEHKLQANHRALRARLGRNRRFRLLCLSLLSLAPLAWGPVAGHAAAPGTGSAQTPNACTPTAYSAEPPASATNTAAPHQYLASANYPSIPMGSVKPQSTCAPAPAAASAALPPAVTGRSTKAELVSPTVSNTAPIGQYPVPSTGAVPGEPNIAVSSGYVVEVTNFQIDVWTKGTGSNAGNHLSSIAFTTFFGEAGL